MSNFLTQLAAKILQPTPAVLPRPASRFESPAAWRPTAETPLEAELQSIAPQPAAPAAAPPRAAAEASSLGTRPAPAEFLRPPAKPTRDAQLQPNPLQETVLPHSERVLRETHSVLETREVPGEPVPARQPPPLLRETVIHDRETRVVEHTRERVVQESRQTSTRQAIERGANRKISEPRGRPQAAQPAAATAPPRPTTRPAPYPTIPAPEATPPIVQVTIGRVEVRAVTETKEARGSRRTGAPRLTLEQYLAQRGGERR
jgi:hypothetical protein